ncbi:uncharacterized protein LOC127122758 [Lathyrus oleraceus]|uniref:uncharacterized protein LOC127122758 n=1 Tax=Pisum sativum TaxID=3888 RepID=UPI0021D10BE0|nr:uncharacterized protein LOC127122758 [Pisum sativum]
MYLTILEGSMGCVFGQHDETGRKEHAIYYLSKKFTDCKSKYSMLEKTCCALAWASKCTRHYMLTHTTLLISKMDPVRYIFEKPDLTDRVSQWQIALTEYDIQHVTQKAIKRSVFSEYPSHQPLEDYMSMRFEFPDEDIMLIKDYNILGPKEGPESGSRWILVFYRPSNAHGNGIGAVITFPTGFHLPFTARFGFECTNNMAEYEACIFSIEATIDLRIKILEDYGDSALVISQVKGDWQARDRKLIPYKEHVLKLTPYFDEITFNDIPGEENQFTDTLETLSFMFKVKWKNEAPTFHLNYLDKHAHVWQQKTNSTIILGFTIS